MPKVQKQSQRVEQKRYLVYNFNLRGEDYRFNMEEMENDRNAATKKGENPGTFSQEKPFPVRKSERERAFDL